ncbi:unnamed protein product, partial [Brenthis ino]
MWWRRVRRSGEPYARASARTTGSVTYPRNVSILSHESIRIQGSHCTFAQRVRVRARTPPESCTVRICSLSVRIEMPQRRG